MDEAETTNSLANLSLTPEGVGPQPRGVVMSPGSFGKPWGKLHLKPIQNESLGAESQNLYFLKLPKSF